MSNGVNNSNIIVRCA